MKSLLLSITLSLVLFCSWQPASAHNSESGSESFTTEASPAKKDSSIFVGRIDNDEYQVYIVMDFYRKNITCPRQEIFGQNPGYFGAKRDTRKWIIEDANISGHTANLVIINDYGSEDLEAKLTYNPHDKTYTLERTEGSTMKIVVDRKWVKIPKKLVFKKK